MPHNRLDRTLALGVAVIGLLGLIAGMSMPVRDRRAGLAFVLLAAALTILHALVYWRGSVVRERFGTPKYFVVQGALVFLIGLTASLVPTALALYVALTVEAVIIAGATWGTMPITIVAILLFGVDAAARSDLYRGSTAALVLCAAGIVGHAIAALLRRARADMPIVQAPIATELTTRPSLGNPSALQHLTAREREVLDALSSGARTSEIATRLGIAERTVKAHLASIYQKLGVESRTAAVAVALHHARA